MSFATEMAAYKSASNKEALATTPAEPQASKAADAPASAEAPVTATSPMPKHGEAYDPAKFDFDQGLPVGAKPVDPAAVAAAPKANAEEKKAETPPAQAVEPEAPPKKAPIKIGTQEFQTIEDAVEYARQLEAAAQADKAYIEGMKDAKAADPKPEPVDPRKELAKKFSERVFENPEEAALELIEQVKQMTVNEVTQQYNRSLEIQAQQTAKRQAWDSFYQSNTDLSAPETRDVLENYLLPKLTKDGQIKPTDPQEKFAELARKHLKIVKAAALPAKELPSEPVTMPGATGEAALPATSAPKEEIVDMVTAMNNLRKRKS